jgi:enoyl-CoA hydratase
LRQFSIKEIDIGMAADLGTLQFFPKRVGNQSVFKELAFTGRNMPAEEALRIGLVSRIFDDKTQLEAGLLETARVIASKSPVGIHTIKEVIKKGEARDLYEGLEYIARVNSVMLQTKDTVESIGAFMQKKKP